eukprot:TRINITY_DN3392_c0_g1_i2.p1 TRINITY_DN3392_c0_g1~~TRINITY_DN3392_c0_g1_i2.p1  ORF type:complete len:260 (-),score=63.61 TRINITY_DN3392_c0_g1_i2:75-854(-)
MRAQRTIFVGNLPVNTKEKEVIKLFKPFGEIESVRFRSIAYTEAKLSAKVNAIKGNIMKERQSKNAYIVFKTAESAKQALELNNTLVGENHIRVDQSAKNNRRVLKTCVFVGNIPFDTEEEALRKLFEENCGEVDYVRLIYTQDHTKCKGFGYVNFGDEQSFRKALKLHDKLEINGRNLRIQKAQDERKKLQQITEERVKNEGKGKKSKKKSQSKTRPSNPSNNNNPAVRRKNLKRKRSASDPAQKFKRFKKRVDKTTK